MEFRWIDWNLAHIERHGVSFEEVEDVVMKAMAPFPFRREDDKWLVWGRGRGGRFLQVVYLVDDDGCIFVIHSRLLTEKEARRYRRTEKR